MSEALVAGIIADTSNPAAVRRLLGDLGRLARVDPGLGRVAVVVLENSSGDAAPGALDEACFERLEVRVVQRHDGAASSSSASSRVGASTGRLPIAAARTLVQRRAVDCLEGRPGAVWILDEDLRLSPLLDAIARGEAPLSQRVVELRAARVDVAVGPVYGAPPLPARSTARVNLEDVWRHLELIGTLGPEDVWPDRSPENARVRRALPEYYYDLSRAHEDAGAHPMWIEREGAHETAASALARLCAGLGGLLDGSPLTRPIADDAALDATRSPLSRGGNTLVLRPELLARIPNLALRAGGRVSRRSDMIWARLAVALESARFARGSIAALQDRSGQGRAGFDADKLLDDARGSALVAALDSWLEEGHLQAGRPGSVASAARAAEVYVDRARARLEAIRGSETQARALVDRILARALSPARHGDFLHHAMNRASMARLSEHASGLRAAYEARFIAGDPEGDRGDVERFLLGLPGEIEAYRARAAAPLSLAAGPIADHAANRLEA
ncbi:MAG: hypothetical protein ABJE95_26095 [Byssovorax sp.]